MTAHALFHAPAGANFRAVSWRANGLRIVQVASVALLALVVISPLLLLLAGSLKDDRYEIITDMGSFAAFWVRDPTLANFTEIAGFSGALPFGRFLFNSTVILIATVTGGILINAMMAFILAWGTIPGRKLMLTFIIALYVVPQETLVMPLLLITTKAGLADGYLAQILPWMASPIYLFLFYQFFIQVPKDLVEAALVDGASLPRIFWSVFLPISLPVMATVAILLGIESWNQYLWPMLVTQTNYARPISVGIASFLGQDTVYWDRAMAASVLMMLPVLGLYILFQRWFISSFLGSAIKG
jgi:multiple sugar transport system permease protein